MRKKIFIVGAGYIGRAVIGNLFHHAGYDLVFYGVTKQKTDLLKKHKEYIVETIHHDGRATWEYIPVYRVVHKDEWKKAVSIMADSDLVACPVYAVAFDDTCRLLADAIRIRCTKTERPMNVLLAINEINAADYFRDKLTEFLSDDADALDYLNTKTGLALTLVVKLGCEASDEAKALDPLAVGTYRNGYIEVIREQFIGEDLDIPQVYFVNGGKGQMVRKIWAGNLSHCMLAFVGGYYGFTDSGQCPQIPGIAKLGMKARAEALQAMNIVYPYLKEDEDWFEEMMDDGMEKPVADSLARIGNKHMKKLSHDDRFVGPALMCYEHGIIPDSIARGMAYGFHYYNPDDPQSRELNEYVKEHGIKEAIVYVCGLPADHPLVDLVAGYYNDLKNGKDLLPQ